jgi:hypothetical protein
MSRAALRILTFTFVTVLSLGLAELVLTMLDRPFRQSWEPSENAVARFDPELGWSYVPNAAATQHFAESGRHVEVAFDEFGARVARAGDGHDPARPSLLLVGCSFTMGHGLTFAESIAGHLRQIPDFPLQGINFAVQGYGTDQALLQLRRHMANFNVKVVVYGFLCDHVRRNAVHDRRLLHPDGRFLGTKPRFQLTADGDLVQTHRPERYDGRTRSRLFDLVRVVWTRYGQRHSLDLTRALVQEMREFATSRHASFLVLDWNSGEEAEWCGRMVLDGLGIPVVRLADHAPDGWTEWRLPGDLHPDSRMTRYAAERLHGAIKTLHLD